MKRLLLAAVAVACLACVGRVAAQGVRFGVGGGVLLPMGDYKDQSQIGDKSGWLVGVDGTYWLSGNQLGIRVEGNYSQTSHQTGIDGNTKIIGGLGELVYAFMTQADQVRPYVLGGVGVFNVKVTVPSVGLDTSETKFGFGVGAGLAFKVGTGSTRVFAEGRYTSVKAFDVTIPWMAFKAGVRFGG